MMTTTTTWQLRHRRRRRDHRSLTHNRTTDRPTDSADARRLGGSATGGRAGNANENEILVCKCNDCWRVGASAAQRSAAPRRVTTWFVHDADGGVTPSFRGAPCSTRLVPASLFLPTLSVSLHATARLSVHVQGRVIDRAECKQIRRSPPSDRRWRQRGRGRRRCGSLDRGQHLAELCCTQVRSSTTVAQTLQSINHDPKVRAATLP